MKKTFLLTLAALATSLVASAGTVNYNCLLFPAQFTGATTGTPTNVTCPGFNAAAFNAPGLNSVTLTYTADYTFGIVPPNPVVTLTFTPSNFSGVTWNSPTNVITVLGGFSSTTAPAQTATANGVTLAAFANSFNVGIASAIPTGVVGTS